MRLLVTGSSGHLGEALVRRLLELNHEVASTPIACGENLYLRWGYTRLLEKKAVDII